MNAISHLYILMVLFLLKKIKMNRCGMVIIIAPFVSNSSAIFTAAKP